jgi:hypothetical protein
MQLRAFTMQLYLFSSENIRNIEIGFKAEKWAVSDLDETTMKMRYTKSHEMKVGAFGLLYCAEDHFFTVPFEVLTQPIFETIPDPWPEPWSLPFNIKPLGTPNRRVSLGVAKHSWHCLRDSTNAACTLNGINGRTIFVPNDIPDDDWTRIINDVGFRGKTV